ncbi:MAG: glycosyltransferase family 2 protein [Rikenellaceae bacterium]|jgi:glycosyltransferase involved in cell wall biosynthesis|nr:glycosyltransferase family 2 protein [Rikenellaceae bacterium]
MKISVVIHTYNSERYLRRCLESVAGFDEVVVCDMHSSDSTEAIAREFGCRLIYHEHTGIAEPARNWAIQQAENEWVLVVDSDEVVPETLRRALYEFVQTKGEEYAGALIPRRNRFMGRFMHGSWPDYILRFMRRTKAYWPPTVNSQPSVEGRVARLPRRRETAFDHLDDPTVERHIDKTNRYTDMERRRRAGQHYSVATAMIKAWFRFVRTYIVKGGFRDGRAGYVYAQINAIYKFLTIAKLWEDQRGGS